MAEKWKAGDVVRLKSGGVPMTVRSVEGEMALCQWFEKGELQSMKFHQDMLTRAAGSASAKATADEGLGLKT